MGKCKLTSVCGSKQCCIECTEHEICNMQCIDVDEYEYCVECPEYEEGKYMDGKKVRETIEDFKELSIQMRERGFSGASKHCDLAIEALEKQLPMKVEYEGGFSNNGFTRYRMAKCPDCDRWHSSRDEIIYCSKCGQRLDWSE